MNRARGVTLIELLITIAILAILVRIAAPSFFSAIQSSYMTSSVNSFMADMRFARSEAIRRGGHVVMCRSNLPESTQACDGTSGASDGWITGWIIFHDLNNNGARNSGEPILRVQSALKSIDSIVDGATNPKYKFPFDATGRLPVGNAATLQFGGSNFPNEKQRIVCVNVGGHARIAGDGYANCN
jgi:type IV fimbrial biogenesis protein FimT